MSSKSLNGLGRFCEGMTNIAFSLWPTVTVVRCLMMRSSTTRPACTTPIRRTFGPACCATARITAVICPGRPCCPPGPICIDMLGDSSVRIGQGPARLVPKLSQVFQFLQSFHQGIDLREARFCRLACTKMDGDAHHRTRDAYGDHIHGAHDELIDVLGLRVEQALPQGQAAEEEPEGRRDARADPRNALPALRELLDLEKVLVDLPRRALADGLDEPELPLGALDPRDGLLDVIEARPLRRIGERLRVERRRSEREVEPLQARARARESDETCERDQDQKGSLRVAASIRSRKGWRSSASVSFGWILFTSTDA